MNKKLEVHEDDMKEFNSKLNTILSSLENSFIECMKKIDETKEIFYTPSGEYFREKVNEYIKYQLNVIDSSIKPMGEQLGTIIKSYDDLYSSIKKSVGGE